MLCSSASLNIDSSSSSTASPSPSPSSSSSSSGARTLTVADKREVKVRQPLDQRAEKGSERKTKKKRKKG
jgi:hypothetical protein